MKKFAVLICFLCLALFCACEKAEVGVGTDTSSEQNENMNTGISGENTGENPSDSKGTNDNLSVHEVTDIGNFTLVRADRATDTVKTALTELHNSISDATGERLSVGTDWSGDSGAEIIIGTINRDEVKKETEILKTDFDYMIKTVGDDILIIGATDDSTVKAVEIFITNFIKDGKVYAPDENTEGYLYNAGMNVDSITIDGVDLSEFKFHYIAAGNTLGGQSTQDEVIAIRDRLGSEYTGIKLEMTDVNIDKDHYIIYDRSGLDYEKGGIKVENGDLILYGSYHSIDYVVEYFFETVLGDNRTIELPSDYSVELSTDDLPDIYSKDDLMDVLQYVYDTNDLLIVGDEVMNSRTTPSTMLEAYKNGWQGDYPGTDTYPSIMGLDLGRCGYKMPTLPDDQWMIISQMICESIEYAAQGGIITIGNHMTNPYPENIPEGASEERGDLGDEQAWIDIITEGTESNARFKSELELNAIVLQAFEDAGVPIIWRPFHECNGGWFWWTPELGEEQFDSKYFVDMWIYVYEFFTEEKGLTNLIWEYSPSTSTHMDVMYLYPGDDYCDIVGIDWYTNGDFEIDETDFYQRLMETGKITNLAEIGVSGSITGNTQEEQAKLYTAEELMGNVYSMYYEDYKVAYFMTYSSKTGLMWLPGGEEVMKSKMVLDLTEMLPLFEKVTGFKPST